jgi:hypothetical protein
MQGFPSSAAAISMAALIALSVLPLSAQAPERPVHPAIAIVNPHLAYFRDYPHSQVKPCLIGIGSCASTYPPPQPCLASIQRCPGDGYFELILAEMASTDVKP